MESSAMSLITACWYRFVPKALHQQKDKQNSAPVQLCMHTFNGLGEHQPCFINFTWFEQHQKLIIAIPHSLSLTIDFVDYTQKWRFYDMNKRVETGINLLHSEPMKKNAHIYAILLQIC